MGGREAAEKHLELYENPGISTSGNRIAAYQTHMYLYTLYILSYDTLLDSHLNTWSSSHTVILTHTHLADPNDRVDMEASVQPEDGLSGREL